MFVKSRLETCPLEVCDVQRDSGKAYESLVLMCKRCCTTSRPSPLRDLIDLGPQRCFIETHTWTRGVTSLGRAVFFLRDVKGFLKGRRGGYIIYEISIYWNNLILSYL